MGEEIAKLALECLKAWLDGQRAKVEAGLKLSESLDRLVISLPKILDALSREQRPLPWRGQFRSARVREPSFELTKEDLLFFANKATLSDLQRLIADLTEVLEARKRGEASHEQRACHKVEKPG